MDSLVSTDWLAQHLGEPDLVVVDSSWFMPSLGRSGHEEFRAAHIPGARFLDIDAVSDRSNPAPHMLPTAREFGEAMEQIGIGHADRIVVYDNSPTRTAARGWFMFRHFGAEKVAILDGGFQKWLSEGRPTESGEPAPRRAGFDAVERHEVVTKEQLLAGTGLPWADARGKPRFEGSEADPRPGGALATRRARRMSRSGRSIGRTGDSSRSRSSGGCSRKRASIPRSRSSPVAAPASLQTA